MQDEVRCRFEGASLEVLGPFPGSGPSVAEAFRRVMHVEAKPAEKIARDTPDIADKITEAWAARARNSGVLGDDGTFLVAGSLEYGWVRVRLTREADIHSLHDSDGDLLFIARSLSGHRVCAVSREGSEYWILEEEFLPGGS
ncbi:hypothetical protein QWJ26_37780 [Streptomyces sp. CSDS2]|uniref:hypothetical protein n=1 Tax=Streptomyces sp. CSDS2 TaxID=3055051 RepID=UPI0025B1BECC|nr:hypothetical protein [Streptomyces sp. CSDS2]MDN3265458.1 hypothetical protein [Streptomyces sp. CSDS2]